MINLLSENERENLEKVVNFNKISLKLSWAFLRSFLAFTAGVLINVTYNFIKNNNISESSYTTLIVLFIIISILTCSFVFFKLNYKKKYRMYLHSEIKK